MHTIHTEDAAVETNESYNKIQDEWERSMAKNKILFGREMAA